VVFSPLSVIPTNQIDHKQVIDNFPINPQETLIVVQDELVSPITEAFERKSRGIEITFSTSLPALTGARPNMTHR
jgi:hypothetical protein